MLTIRLAGICIALVFSITLTAKTQEPQNTDVDHPALIQSLQKSLSTDYIELEKATQLNNALSELLNSQDLSALNHEALAEFLTQKLQKVAKDQHLRIEYSEEPFSDLPSKTPKYHFENEVERVMWRSHNLGFDKLERLPFNIGYLKLSAIAPLEDTKPMLASAFTFLNSSNALILDLRGNFGGYEYTIGHLTGYLLTEKTHLFDMYSRKENQTEKRWSSATVEGPKYDANKPIYVLIDADTFSAAEVLAYTLKHLGRATIVGENSAGASNAGDDVVLSPHFKAFIPSRKMINPVTQANFENVGVIPDVKATANEAINQAQRLYLNSLLEKTEATRKKERIIQRLENLSK